MSGNYTTIANQNVAASVPVDYFSMVSHRRSVLISLFDILYVTDRFVGVDIVAGSRRSTAALKFADSNLRTFPPSGAQGKIYGGTQPPRDADDSFGKSTSGSDDPQQSGWFRSFTIAAYRPYFDVDTFDVLERIKDSLFPLKGSFSEKTANNPDLYGPFWICTTLIFVAASISTFVNYIAHKVHKKEWDYDINLMTWSAGLFYGYVSIVPLALYLILKYFSVPSDFFHLLCLYGYSLFIFIPAVCFSVIPQEIVRWVFAGVAGFMSATYVALNLRNHIKSAGESWFVIVAGSWYLLVAASSCFGAKNLLIHRLCVTIIAILDGLNLIPI